jgi:hypothetical protein
MNNKKSLLQDSLQELENIKNESLELAKEQLINESADLLEKKSSALFEKLIAGEDVEEEETTEEESPSKMSEMLKQLGEESEEESSNISEILNELSDMYSDEEDEEDEEEEEEDDMYSDEENEEEEEMSLDALRKAAEEHGFKLVADSDEEEMDSDEEEMDSDEEEMEMDSDEEEMDSEEEDDIEFNDVDVDDKVLAEAFSNKKNNKSIKTKNQITEGISDKAIQSIQNWISQLGTRKTAVKLVDLMISRQTGGLTSSDLGDTATFANGLDDIESFLEENDFEGALSAAKSTAEDMLYDEGFEGFGLDESLKRNNKNMRNTKKQVLKDLRDVSFNKLVEEYYNMKEEDSFVVKEGDPDEEYDDGYGSEETMHSDYEDEKSFRRDRREFEKPYIQGYDDDAFSDAEMDELEDLDEDTMYEIDMNTPENQPMYDEELTDDEISEMLAEMDAETMYDVEEESGMNRLQRNSRAKASERKYKGQIGGFEEGYDMEESAATDIRDKYRKDGLGGHHAAEKSELEEMFNEMSLEELQEMEDMLQEDGDMGGEEESTQDGQGGAGSTSNVRFKTSAKEDYSNLTEEEIEEMINSMNDEDLEESSLRNGATKKNRGNRGAMPPSGRPHRQSGILGEEMDEEEMTSLHEKVKKLEIENKNLQEGFTNKVKSLENKVYDVTISALKAGFVNKFLLEHPLRENEKLQIIHRFANAQTKEQIKETYISLTNEFAKGQTAKDGSMLNESVQNKVSRVHKTDNAIVTEKNLMNENDESNRFKQLLNYNFGKKK